MRIWLALVGIVAVFASWTAFRHVRATRGTIVSPRPALLSAGDWVYSFPHGETDRRAPAHFIESRGDRVLLHTLTGFPEETARATIVPLATLVPGDLMDVSGGPRGANPNCRTFVPVVAVTASGITVACSPHELGAETLYVPGADAISGARAQPWMGVIESTLCLLFIGFAARAWSRSSDSLRILDGKTGAGAPGIPVVAPIERPKVEVLRCGACGKPVPISLEANSRCPACGANIEQPAAFRELEAIWKGEKRLMKKEARALILVEKLANPLFAWSLRLAALLFFCLPLAFMVINLRSLISDRIATLGFFATFPLLVSPLPLFLAAAAVKVAGQRLRPAIGFLSALKDPNDALICRNCGAPLLFEEGGIACVCFYCGAQNLIREKMEVDLAAAQRLNQSRTVTIGLASNIFWESLIENSAWAAVLLFVVAAPLYLVMALT